MIDIATDAIARLRADPDTTVITPQDGDFDTARELFYGGLDRRPAVIARPTGAAAVAAVLAVARETGLPLAVRSGGHGLLGHASIADGIVLDLRDLRSLDIDAADQTAWAGAGLTAGEYTAAAAAHGLATGFGDTGSVGIGGLTVGGGVGFLSRKHGLTIDQLLAAEIVTADGTVRVVDADTDPDLFWAIRGGGGNVGVVTRFKFRLHELPSVVAGMLILPASPEVVHGFAAAADAAPEELTTIANIMASAPPIPFLPAEVHGKPIVMGLMAYAGDTAAGEQALDPFRSLATPLFTDVGPKPYADLFPPEEEVANPAAAVETLFLDRVDHRTASTIMACLDRTPAPMAVVQLRVLGGAVSRVPGDATAYAHRDRRIMVNVAAMDFGAADAPPDATDHRPWVTATAQALAPDGSGRYVNFVGSEGHDQARAAFPGSTWDRLARIKQRYDPDNLLRHNVNVPPTGATATEAGARTA
ncbi:MAG TPA: FAD-binding protein [Euzebya sp.]|nr:FAD-binding protein [Euzebya sp.]